MSGLSDWNDLARVAGLDAVRQQLMAALSAAPAASQSPPDESPAPPSGVAPLSIELALERFALAMPDGKCWDAREQALLKTTAARALMGADLYKEWVNHPNKRTVNQWDVTRQAAATSKGGGGLRDALGRYIYLSPSADAWDTERREIVPLSVLRFAIADCFDDWLKHPERKEIARENLVFDPQQRAGSDVINLFRGLPLRPVNDLDACRAARAVIWSLCNEDNECFEWLTRWLAYPLQHVGAKMATAVLMHSDVEGSGKSLLFDGYMKRIYGEYGATLGQHQLESQYTDWRSKLLFGVFEEVLSRDQKYSHTGTIKHMITGETHRIEKKFVSGWEEANHMNSVFLSNEFQPFPIIRSDRRMLVMWPEKPLPLDLQQAAKRELEADGVAAMYGWLLSIDLGDFDRHTKPPMTKSKQRLIEFGMAGWEVFLQEWQTGTLEWPCMTCLAPDLYQAYRQWCQRSGERHVSMNKFCALASTRVHRVRDARYEARTRKGTFFVIDKPDVPAWLQEPGESRDRWFGRCAAGFSKTVSAAGLPGDGDF